MGARLEPVMSRPIRATVSPAALRHNYAAAKRAAPGSRVYAVVKANAYGHGLERTARALGNADGFALLELDGALMLREQFPSTPVLLLEGCFEGAELAAASVANVAIVVHSEEQLRMLETDRITEPIDAWLKVNSGMNRLGIPPAAAHAAYDRLKKCANVRSVTLMTHFANSELADGTSQAMRVFGEATRGLPGPRSLANTAAIFAHPETHADISRLGIGLYGATPFADRPAKALGLRPAMSLTSRLIAVQELAAGDAIGYGSTFRADLPMRIGVVACGYADGYPRHAPSGTPILVAGARTRTVGRVSMDMMTVDITAVPSAKVGSAAVLWGEGIPVDEVAIAAGTVGYELLCAVSARVPMQEDSAG